MAKSPKSDDEIDKGEDTSPETPKDDVEDAEIIEETGTETPEGEAASDDASDEDDTDTEEAPATDRDAEAEADSESENEVEPDSDSADAEATDDQSADETAPTPWESGVGDTDTETEADSETANASSFGTPATPATIPSDTGDRSGGSGAMAGFGGMVLGGIVAGVIGFGVAQYFVPGSWPFGGEPEADPLAETVETQSANIAELRALVESQAQSIERFESDSSVEELGSTLQNDLGGIRSRLDDLSGRIDAMDERVATLERMPQGDSAEAAETAAAAYERELAEMREMLDEELANLEARQQEAEQLQVNATQAAEAASARAALSRIMAALDSGQPFDDALFDLTNATGAEAPDALASVAEDGVPTLGQLQQSFPDMAREALDLSLRALVETGEIGRLEALARTQLGTRSLTPQEGDDPDAILSRAQFAIDNGRIQEALGELEAMPDAAQPAMEDWIATAETRLAALEAGSTLAQDLNQ